MSQSESTKTESTGASVLAEVATALTQSAPLVKDRLVKALTERELVKRVDILDKALVKRQQLLVETKKLRPSKMALQKEDGSFEEIAAPVSVEEAKKFQKAVKEAAERLQKFDDLLEKAFTSPDKDTFDKLAKQVAGGGSSEE